LPVCDLYTHNLALPPLPPPPPPKRHKVTFKISRLTSQGVVETETMFPHCFNVETRAPFSMYSLVFRMLFVAFELKLVVGARERYG
jgi:hypothetical protein